MLDVGLMKEKAIKILENYGDHEWSVQGLGMLRTYLDDEHVQRLHIWSPNIMFPGASPIHTHPWHFTSHILCGQITNYKLVETTTGVPYWKQRLLCGENGCLMDAPEEVRLRSTSGRKLIGGMSYSMDNTEIHETQFEPGTTSLIIREFEEDTDHANVYWPTHCNWGSAEPRPATEPEVRIVTRQALKLLTLPIERERLQSNYLAFRKRAFESLDSAIKNGYELNLWTSSEIASDMADYDSDMEGASESLLVPIIEDWKNQRGTAEFVE